MDRLDMLEAFVKAAERQSFTGAAEALRIERSQVTRRIQSLEKALGVRLFSVPHAASCSQTKERRCSSGLNGF